MPDTDQPGFDETVWMPSRPQVRFTVNGRSVEVPATGTRVLAETLRTDLGLTGTHIGCDTAQCGACVVHLNGKSVKSCTVLTRQIDGQDIRTIEGLAPPDRPTALQAAFEDHHAVQCGFCTAGLIMGLEDFLEQTPARTDEDILAGLKGHICRCTGYRNIMKAVVTAAAASSQAERYTDKARHQGVGAAIPRKEDRRFLTGRGQYVSDVTLPNQAYAAFARSPVAHAHIRSVDLAAARQVDGVIDIFTGEDVARAGLGELWSSWRVMSKDGTPMRGGKRPLLAKDKVRFVGDAYALVIAETVEAAVHAASLIIPDFEALPAFIDPAASMRGEALHAEAPDNHCFRWAMGDEAGVEAAFATAHHVTEITLINNRVIPNALETRAAVAAHDAARGKSTLHTTSQNPHMARRIITETLGISPEHSVRVISPDVGGGFGSKIFIYPEECLSLWASRKLDRPVKWVATRREAFQTDVHGRDHRSTAKLALDKDGRFLALKVDTTANLGAYLSGFAAFVPTFLYATMLAGPYRTPLIHVAVDGVFTNTAPVDAYRGAGRPEAVYLLERLIDEAANDLGEDPAELRRKNLIAKDQFPYRTPVALEYDIGDYEPHLDLALQKADYEGFEARKAEAAKEGRLRGIGLSCYVEACGIGPSALAGLIGADVGLWESALLRMTPSGSLQVFTGSHAHGQGHETTFAQIAADRLGLQLSDIDVIHGDTDQTPVGMGTFGSRSAAVGGSAVARAADKLIEKGRTIAAQRFGCDEGNVVFDAGAFICPRTTSSLSIQEIAKIAYVPHIYPAGLEPGFEASAVFDPVNFTYPSGTHVCEVEITPETGEIRIVNFVAVDDFGTLINPAIVEGQVVGGVVQGIGQALFEAAQYDDEDGTLLSNSFRSYAMPRAADTPPIFVDHTTTPAPNNPTGAKGCGEAGAIAAPPAIMNAIANALGRPLPMPATRQAIWEACQAIVSSKDEPA
ncbi:MAG: molybdopterin-dependent oxidoreductase [Pseudomonadota bacterium]